MLRSVLLLAGLAVAHAGTMLRVVPAVAPMVVSISGPPACVSPKVQVFYIDVKGDECGQVCVTSANAGLIKEVLKATDGSCAADTPYTTFNTTTAVTVTLIGKLEISTFYEPATKTSKWLHTEQSGKAHCDDLITDDMARKSDWWKEFGYKYKKWAKGKCPQKYNFVNSVDGPAKHIVHRVMGVSTAPTCGSPNERLYYVDVKKPSAPFCGEVCVTSAQVGLITGVMKAKKGSCAADTVYTVYNTTTTINVIVIGALTIATFDKPATVAIAAPAAPAAPAVHFPTYCNYKGYCHCPPLPVQCKSDADCQTPWYNSYCQTSGSCHSELPPACVKDTDCSRPAAKATKAAPVQVEQIEQIFASLS